MKALYLMLIASGILLTSSIARAHECPMGQSMMGQGMTGHGMMGQGMMGHGMMGRGMGAMGMMGQRQDLRLMTILMDTDGDGALSLEEVQAAHVKIFKAVDADKNGKIAVEEIQTFFGGGPSPSP
ncbi:EF-hand domain-containing protein [Taklimakanibacter deserti]|uniref:EF-hand domain-containing protein n=1 Tax=Taklimakanibacter deserti TaxID=2267839 RepID=UPI000E65E389